MKKLEKKDQKFYRVNLETIILFLNRMHDNGWMLIVWIHCCFRKQGDNRNNWETILSNKKYNHTRQIFRQSTVIAAFEEFIRIKTRK